MKTLLLAVVLASSVLGGVAWTHQEVEGEDGVGRVGAIRPTECRLGTVVNMTTLLMMTTPLA